MGCYFSPNGDSAKAEHVRAHFSWAFVTILWALANCVSNYLWTIL